MESVIYGLAYLQKKDISHGDIHPTNIFYDQTKDNYKIGNPFFTQKALDLTK